MNVIHRLIAAAGAIALFSLAGPAWVGGPYTVKAGSIVTGSANFIGFTTGAVPQVTIPSIGMACDSSTVAGVVHLGSNQPGTNIASIDSSTWANCRKVGFHLGTP